MGLLNDALRASADFIGKVESVGRSANEAAFRAAGEQLPFQDAAFRCFGRMDGRTVYVGLYDNRMKLKTNSQVARKAVNVIDFGLSPFGKGEDAQEWVVPYRQITSIKQQGKVGVTELVVSTPTMTVTLKESGSLAADIREFLEARI